MVYVGEARGSKFSTFVSQNNVCKYFGIMGLSILQTSNLVKAVRPLAGDSGRSPATKFD